MKFLFCEDGSVDVNEVQKAIEKSDEELHLITYRQGSIMPKLLDTERTEKRKSLKEIQNGLWTFVATNGTMITNQNIDWVLEQVFKGGEDNGKTL